MANEYDSMANKLFKNKETAEGAETEYDSIAKSAFEPKPENFERSQFVARKKQPEQVTEAMKLSRQHKVPVDFAERNLKALKEKSSKTSMDYESIIARSPRLAKWMENPYNATVANNDLDTLSKAETNLNRIRPFKEGPSYADDLGKAAKGGFHSLQASSLNLAAAYGMVDIQDVAQDIADKNKQARSVQTNLPQYAKDFNVAFEKEFGDVKSAFNQWKTGFEQIREGHIIDGLANYAVGNAKTIGETIDFLGDLAINHKRAILRSATESVAFSAPSLATGLAGGAAGAAAGSAVPVIGTAAGFVGGTAIGTFTGSATTEIGAWVNQSLEERGFDITNPDDIVRAYRNKELMAEVRGEAQRKGITTAGVDALFSMFAGGLAKGARGVGSRVARGAGDVAIQAVGEGVSEGAGQVAAHKGDLSKVSINDVVLEGIVSMGHSIAEVGTVGTAKQAIEVRNRKKIAQEADDLAKEILTAQESISELQALEQLGDIAKESQLQTNDPEMFGEFIAEINQDGGAEQSVYYQKEQWDEYWRSKGESPVAKAEELLGGDSYRDSEVSGQSIEIPLAEYIAKMGDKPEFGDLMQISRTKPHGMTVAEAQQSLKELPQRMDALAKEAQADKAARDQVEAGVKQVRQRLESQLKAAGRDPVEAAPLMAFYETLGAKEGIDPQELAQKYGLDITAVDETSNESGEIVFDQKEKGRIKISGNNKFNIELLKNADKSTFIHESGHYFLEVLKDMSSLDSASQELKNDFGTIMEWLGAESPDQITTEQHEQWARGFEAYLREGKAPTEGLRKAFNTFKVWLTSIYKNVSQLNVELSDDIRGVMDRMLATDEDIEQSKRDLADIPLFIDPVEMGMTQEKAAEYRLAAANSEFQAKENLQKQVEKSVARRKKILAKINREQLTKEAQAQPIYQAIALIKSNDSADGQPLLKFDRSIFSKKYPDIARSKKFRGMFAKDKNGMDPDVIASVVGFQSGNDLVAAIVQQPELKDLVEFEAQRLADQEMAKEESPEAMAAAADEALHNMSRAKRLRMEYEHLASNNVGLTREVTRRVVSRPVPDKELKGLATKIINNLSVGKIKPNHYRLAERRHAKEAGKLLAAGDVQGAFLSKQKELLNHYLYRESQSAVKVIRKAEKQTKRFFEKDEKLSKTRDIDFVAAGRAVLARYNLGKSNLDAMSQIQKVKEYNPDAYETLSSIIIGLVESPDDYKNIGYGQFTDLITGLDSLWTLAKDVKEVEVGGQKLSIDQANKELIEEMSRFKKKKGQEKYDRTANDHEIRNSKLLGAKAVFRRFEHWIDVMDLGNVDGPFRKYLFTPVSEASDRFTLENKKVKERYKKLSEPIAKKIDYKKVINSDELGFQFKNKSELLGALLHTGNASNMRKLLVGRGWGLLDEDNNLVTTKWDQFIQRMWDEQILTKEDYDYIQSVWDLMEDLKPAANQAHRKVFGYYFDEITSQEIKTPFGTYRGGYAPAKVDPFAVTDIARKAELEEFIKGHQSYTYPASGGRGFTKSRVDNFNKPLSLDMSLVSRHISDVLKFSIIKPAVVDSAKVLMSKDFKAEMGEIDSQVIEKMIKPALNRADKNQIYNSDPSSDSMIMSFFNGIRTNSAMQIMFFNVTNTIEQVGGFGISATRISPKYIGKSMGRYMRNPKEISKLVQEKSVLMRTRTDDQIFEMEKEARTIFSEESIAGKVQNWALRHAYFTQAFTQNIVDNITWQASYEESITNGLTEQSAIRKADADIRITQSSRRPIDVSNFETNQWVNFFNMFYSFFNMMANVNASNFIKLYHEDMGLKQKFMKGFYLYWMGFATVAIVSESVKKAAAGSLDADDDDEILDDLYDVFIGSQINLGFAMVPVAGSAINAGYKELVGGKPYETKVSASPAASILATGLRAGAKLAKGELTDNKLKRAEIRDSLTALGLITGVPLTPLSKPINYLRDVQSGKAKPSGPFDAVRGVLTGKPGVN